MFPATATTTQVRVCTAALLITLTCIVYAQTPGFGFVSLDDPQYILTNPALQDGLSIDGIRQAWTHFYFSNWHPVTTTSWMLEIELAGKNPHVLHATNVVLHAVNVILLYSILLRLTGAQWRSAIVAVIFAVHPIHVESVAWISERKDLLCFLFGQLTINAYVDFAQHRRRRPYVMALFAFLACLLSKQMLVTLPCLLLLLDLWPLQRLKWVRESGLLPCDVRKVIVEKLSFFALSVAFCAIIVAAQGRAIAGTEVLMLWDRLAHIPVAYTRYVAAAYWPVGLAMYYPFPLNEPVSITSGVASVLLLVGITVAAVYRFRQSPWMLVGWLWFLGTLVPVIGFIQVGGQSMADRYAYMSFPGLYIAVVWESAELMGRARVLRLASPTLAVATTVVLTVTAWRQVSVWENSETLYRHTLSVTTGNHRVVRYLAGCLIEQGRLDEAMVYAREAIDIAPSNPWNNRLIAQLHHLQGDSATATQYFQRVVRLAPQNAELLFVAGQFFQDTGKSNEAMVCYQQILQLSADVDTRAHVLNNVGTLLFEMGDTQRARRCFERVLAMHAGAAVLSEAETNLGVIEAVANHPDSAARHFEAAIERNSGNAVAHLFFARVLQSQGHKHRAERHFEAARQLDPTLAVP